MNKVRLWLIMLFPFAILLNFLASKFPALIEFYYSQKINKFTVQILSNITGILPFSLYEITVYLVLLLIIFLLFYISYILLKFPNTFLPFIKKLFLNVFAFLSLAYFLFAVLWGLNYNRLPLESTLIDNFNIKYNKNISSITHSSSDLINLYKHLVDEVNKARLLVSSDENSIMKCDTDYKGVFNRASLGYENIDPILSFEGTYGIPKAIFTSPLMCYTGITGIYFPFTGEANINVAPPDIHLPATVLHEMAHQRGYASEDEANFLAYLSCINHPDNDFKYSGLVLALIHTGNQLYKYDYDNFKKLYENLSDDVKTDLAYNREFWNKYEGKVERISDNVNNSYLKANGINDGVANYGKMVDLLLTYEKLKGYQDR